VNRHPSLSETATSALRELIVAGELPTGRVLSPDALSELLGMSSTPIREALQVLRIEGFVDQRPRRGFSVAALDGDDIRDAFLAQSLIAGELAARAAQHRSPDTVARLDAAQEALAAAARSHDGAAAERANHDFHRVVNLAAASSRLQHILTLLTRYVPRTFYGSIPGWQDTSLRDHGAILRSIDEGRPDDARDLMRAHIQRAGALLAEHYDARTSARDAAS
jgi:DNA-binding GntR family transcriptional regulator